MSMFFYSMLAFGSATKIFTDWFIDFYNVFYCSLPPLIYGSNDQDVSKALSAHSPRLYAGTLHRIYYTHSGFVRWILEAMLVSLLWSISLPS